jgi:hypothetical protein
MRDIARSLQKVAGHAAFLGVISLFAAWSLQRFSQYESLPWTEKRLQYLSGKVPDPYENRWKEMQKNKD